MGEKDIGKRQVILLLCIFLCLHLAGGCYFKKPRSSDKKTLLPGIGKIVVVKFQAALSPGASSNMVRDPLSGAVFSAEPVPGDVAQQMTDTLFDRLVTEGGYELISPGQAEGVFSSIVDSDMNAGMEPVKILQKVGKAFEADAVLAGYVYRWRERLGTDYAIDSPASVAFDLNLVRPADGAILWRASFDKTQRSLSENVLDLATFLEGGGRWMTAKKLAMQGLDNLLKEMPAGSKKREDQ